MFSSLIIGQLIKRGYEYKSLKVTRNIVGSIERDKLICYKNKNSNNNTYNRDSIKLKLVYDNSYLDLRKNIIEMFQKLKNKFINSLKDFKFDLTLSLSNNFKMLFIDNFKINFFSLNYTNKCNNCSYCNLIYNISYIKHNNIIIPLYSKSTCNAINCVYIITCIKCNIYYIGQSKNLKNRISNHKNVIKNYKTIMYRSSMENKSKYVVGEHFNLNTHSINDHFRICVFRDNIESIDERLSIENDLIHLFRLNKLTVYNDYIPIHNYVKKLCYNT